MTCRDAAFDYRALGLHPIPIEPRGKLPLVPWKGFQDVAPSVELLRYWWAEFPEANVGLVMGRGMFALDIDGPEGIIALGNAGIALPDDAPCSLTSHGFHMFFAGKVPDKVGLLPKVDVRGAGYVVAPPSQHESGHVYRWVRPFSRELPVPPLALTMLLTAPARPIENGSEPWVAPSLRQGAGKGARDVTCFRLASYFASKGLPPDVSEAILQGFADRCHPPLPYEDVAAKVRQASRYEIKRK